MPLVFDYTLLESLGIKEDKKARDRWISLCRVALFVIGCTFGLQRSKLLRNMLLFEDKAR